MRKTLVALLGAMVWVAVMLSVSSWRQGLVSDPWWHNFLRVTGGFAAMYLVFFVSLGLPGWVKRREKSVKS
ncbi:MAG: hypothetical protein AB7U87_00775 [Candidatus Bipolaricaulis sp.]